ncbi:hypothetical protein K431DRAFT_290291 [Polychaeton citri CBS 116435]|uniref:25S rRNA (Uridine(2843)-N(3))-methyltransferase n=1 Tax=Polychaeton citri CBS 116435 TaxID=1314669 RepID=A0A9P4QJA4_9PEZI|nr:hypothetical protein K431DRAFT_290291 [Polychaeton citri CBS 116435]
MAKGATRGQKKSKPKAAPSRSGPNSTSQSHSANTKVQDSVSRDLQQKCLSVFKDTLDPGESDKDILQAVKGHLFEREFAAAFSKEENLKVYASRWSPSRTLGYMQIFEDIKSHLTDAVQVDDEALREGESRSKVLFFGGASAEIVAFAGWLKHNQINKEVAQHWKSGEAVLVDVADWKPVVDALHHSIINPPPISKYASATAKEANTSLLAPETFSASFLQHDVLDLDDASIRGMVGGVDLVTLLFTLNELYSCSIAKTQRLMSQFTACCRTGTLLLVVDSPGSYSTVSINGAEKKYPMHWLLDHTLVGPGQTQQEPDTSSVKWNKVVTADSKWFRLPSGLEYPIKLEDMRYQIHLYRRMDGGTEET